MIQSNIINHDGVKSATIILGDAYTVDQSHPQWDEILDILLKDEHTSEDEERLHDLLSPAEAIQKGFKRLSDRVSVRDGNILFDNDRIENDLTELILETYQDNQAADRDFALGCLVNFMEKLYVNPDSHSRENLFRWMKNRSFSITEDGDLIAFKGVRSDRMSVNQGFAIVDGVEVDGRIPNEDGSIIEMPRSRVDHNPASACSTGLHAGTHGYASTFAESLIAVRINPRDVVSVPTDTGGQKMRTCRYEVLGKFSNAHVPLYITVDDLFKHHLHPEATIARQGRAREAYLDRSEAPTMTTPTPPTVTEQPTEKQAAKKKAATPKKVAKKATKTKSGLSVSDVVPLTKYGNTWVKDHAAELGGTKVNGQWRFENKTKVKAALKRLNALA